VLPGIEHGLTVDALQRAAGLHAHAPIARVGGTRPGSAARAAIALDGKHRGIISLDGTPGWREYMFRRAIHRRPVSPVRETSAFKVNFFAR